jgi:hypothetical protein
MCCTVGLTVVSAASADDTAQREDQFKAAYVLNFAKFVEWPATIATDTLNICFVGGTGVYDALSVGIADKRAGARRVAAKKLAVGASFDNCNVLYIDGASPRAALPAVSQAVLTVGNVKAFADHDGMIELFTINNRLRFNINVDRAQKAGLRISSDLLKLAAEIKRSDP